MMSDIDFSCCIYKQLIYIQSPRKKSIQLTSQKKVNLLPPKYEEQINKVLK